ncbi:MAG: hypothetical protein AAF696_33585 [Bacteroidota bacterium]
MFYLIRTSTYKGGNIEYGQKLMAIVDAMWTSFIPAYFMLPAYFYFTQFSAGFWCVLHMLFYLVVLVIVLRRTGNIKLFANLTAIVIFNSYTLMASLTGGIESPIVVMYSMAIPIVYDFGGPKMAIRWIFIYLLLFMLFAIIDLFIFPFPELMNAEISERFLFVAMLGIFLFHGLYSYLWTTSRQELLTALSLQQKTIYQQEKMASIGQLTAGMAHEINNPLNFASSNNVALQLNIQDLHTFFQSISSISAKIEHPQLLQIQGKATEIELESLLDEIPQLGKGIQNGLDRIQQIIKSLRYVSYTDKEEKELIDIHESLDAALQILEIKTKDRIKIRKQYQAKEKLMAFPGQLNQVFINILNNAMQAIE